MPTWKRLPSRMRSPESQPFLTLGAVKVKVQLPDSSGT